MASGQITTRVGWRLTEILDPVHATYAVKVGLAAVLTLATAFLFDLQNTYWALLTIPLVVRPQAGTLIWRGVARLAGTLIGAFAAILLVGCFGQSAGAMITALSLWIFGAGYLARLEGGIDAYSYAVAATTALLIAIDTGANVVGVYGFALARTTETAIAIVASFVVLLVVLPVSQEDLARAKTADAVSHVLTLAQASLTGSVATSARQVVMSGLLAIQTDLRATAFERSHRGDGPSRLAAVAAALLRLTVAADAAGIALRHLAPEARDEKIEAACGRLADLLAKAREVQNLDALPDATSLDALLASVDPGALADALRGDGQNEHQAIRATALLQLHDLAMALRSVQQARAALSDTTLPSASARPITTRYKDHGAALQAGLRPMITFLASASVWLSCGWSAGGIFTLLTTTLTMVLPTIVPRAALPGSGVSIGLGYAVGAVLVLALMMVLPALEDFTPFALLIGSTIFVVFYLTGTPQTLSVGIGATQMLALGLQPTNDPAYSFLHLANTVATLAPMPAVFLASVVVLFPENHEWLRRRLRRGLDSLLSKARTGAMEDKVFLAQGVDILGDYGGDLPPAEAKTQRLFQRGRAVLVAGTESAALRRLARTGSVPRRLADHLPALLSALGVKTGGDPATTPAAFEAVRAECRALLAQEPLPWAHPADVLRFMASCELLQALICSGDLGAAPVASHSVPAKAGRP